MGQVRMSGRVGADPRAVAREVFSRVMADYSPVPVADAA